MTIGLTWRRTARRIKRLKEGVLTISPDYSDRDPRLFGALAPRVVNNETHEQLRVHSRASGTRLSGAVSGTCGALPCSPRSSPLAPPTPPLVAQVCSSASMLL